jgi:dethiobiotin synthetase
MPRPRRVVAVCGTGTDVGKTWVGAGILRAVAGGGATVCARKPVQSFEPDQRHRTDAHALAQATGETPEQVCPSHRWYDAALAPPLAADALGRPAIALADLLAELVWPTGCEVGLVETAGGVRSPIAHDGDCVDLIHRLAPDVTLLVGDAGLGAINAVRLSLVPLAPLRCVVYLNRFDPESAVHQGNRRWLTERDGLTVVTDVAAAATVLSG